MILISDFLSVDGEGEWSEQLARLSRRHDLIAVRPVDPLEEELPDVGLLTLRGISAGGRLEIDTRAKAVREAWEAAATRRRESIHAQVSLSREPG